VKRSEQILQLLSEEKKIAVLIDPEKSQDTSVLDKLIEKSEFAGIHFFFIGGSTVKRSDFQRTAEYLKKKTEIPLVIFPGSSQQLSERADAILYLSLLSGRNPDYLIGHHVQSAAELFDMDIEVIPTAYILIDGDSHSSVAYVSQTTPIPRDQISIIQNTAMAGILQGKKIIYLDAGSGAKTPVPQDVVRSLRLLGTPLITGGGIKDIETIRGLHKAGSNLVVIGNKLEEDTDLLLDIQAYIRETKCKTTFGKI
jgi:phosphoglycerol geranylgeranyltransferase